ncbi:4a-hydroxytetrahydrobiopterin dehydratase [Evansella clarkii]|jgi:4a-hydroxytetrahydrobiopterin dehydratase|uniref:4a-hydroxytetrahydrobiopterin dehydratase n=1 Tax=Evansella clarkii TaxID=79879 RepID=UPI00099790D0|nr:4a-hydroxytetrahydrobiopterin dehydratase [Evansella clarkii]
MVLTAEEVEASLYDSEGWDAEDGKWIKKEYEFRSFRKAISFVNEIAGLAQDRQHHPKISIDRRRVQVKLSTMDKQGLTQKDFESAYAYDRTYEKYI